MTEERQFPDFCKICLRQCSWPPVTRNQLGCNGYDSTVHSTGVHSTQYSAAVLQSRSKHTAAASEARRDWCGTIGAPWPWPSPADSSSPVPHWSVSLHPGLWLVQRVGVTLSWNARNQPATVLETMPRKGGFSVGNKCDILAIFAIFHLCQSRWWAQCGNIRLGPGLAVTSDHPWLTSDVMSDAAQVH